MLSQAKSRAPEPEKVKDEVVRSFCCGKRNTRLHVLPLSPLGMSKLKMEETLLETSPKKDVPGALLGLVLSTGMMR